MASTLQSSAALRQIVGALAKGGVTMLTLYTKTATIAALLLLTVPAIAHSWYPKECCSDRDCSPADTVRDDPRGGLMVSAGNQSVWVPSGFPRRSSPDNRVHICFRMIAVPDEGVLLIPLCVFLPAEHTPSF